MFVTLFKKQIPVWLIVAAVGAILAVAYAGQRALRQTPASPAPSQTESGSKDDVEEDTPATDEPGQPSQSGTGTAPDSPGATTPPTITNSPSAKKQIIPILDALAYEIPAQKVIATGFVEGQFNATCTITFEKAGYSSVVISGPTELQSNRSTCPRFEISKSAFPTTGDWTARLRIHSDSVEGTSDSGMVTIT